MRVEGGYDTINKGEATAAEVMKGVGYSTAHFGKWHNGVILGYEGWNVGFEDSTRPTFDVYDTIFNHNGEYEFVPGLMEQALMDRLLAYLKQQLESEKPFFLYYALYSIHKAKVSEGGAEVRQYPAGYKDYFSDPKYSSIPAKTLQAWIMLKYMDDVLGRLFNYIDNSPLRDNTYVMIMGDNGSDMLANEENHKALRMPSGMVSHKSSVMEGGIRNHLAVRGPGVHAGVVDSTLLHVIDILPTMADLAGIQPGTVEHLRWEGISFSNLLLPGDAATSNSGFRGDSLATTKQRERFVFAVGPQCWSPDAVPELDDDRQVVKPQPLLDFSSGGMRSPRSGRRFARIARPAATGPGFEACIVVRHKEYKWIGETHALYRFADGSHVELDCNLVTDQPDTALMMLDAAKAWWGSVLAEPYSFQKPVYFLGLKNAMVSNMETDGAYRRTARNITLLSKGATGFRWPGDKMCFKTRVARSDRYNIIMFYTSWHAATVQLSVGEFGQPKSNTASITVELPATGVMKGQRIGTLDLKASEGTPAQDTTETCLTLLDTTSGDDSPVFANLANIRFVSLHGRSNRPSKGIQGTGLYAAATAPAASAAGSRVHLAASAAQLSASEGAAAATPVAVPANNPDIPLQSSLLLATSTGQARPQLTAAAAAPVHTAAAAGKLAPSDPWAVLKDRFKWPEGQEVLEGLWSPYDNEGDIEHCMVCNPTL